jgi:hypothetical protein
MQPMINNDEAENHFGIYGYIRMPLVLWYYGR